MKQISISIPRLEYREDEKKMIIDIDFRESKILIGKSLIKRWEPPYQLVELTEEMKEDIYRNIKKYLLKRYKPEDILEIY